MNRLLQFIAIVLVFIPILALSSDTAIVESSNKSNKHNQSPLALPMAVQGDSCVAPLDVMRRDHMNLLFHQRDRTMYSGERDTKHSLTGCLNCHTQKDDGGKFIAVNAPGQFCAQCHSYTAVKIDCFECHATTPRQ